MRPIGKYRTQLHTNLEIELFSVLHVSQNELIALITFLKLELFLDRLRTIISYDRICVLDAGQIAVRLFIIIIIIIIPNCLFQEFDTPINLFGIFDGIFRSMCERSGVTLEDIKLAVKKKTGKLPM